MSTGSNTPPPSSAPPPPPTSGGGRLWILLILLVVLAGGGYWLFGRGRSEEATPPLPPPPVDPAPSTALVPTTPPTSEPPAPVTKAPPSPAKNAGNHTGGFTGPCGGMPTHAEQVAFVRYARDHAAAVRRCYERRLKVNNILQGRMEVQVTIGGAGNVLGTHVVSDSVRDHEVAACVQDNVRSWRLPPPTSGCVQVTYPFNFQPSTE